MYCKLRFQVKDDFLSNLFLKNFYFININQIEWNVMESGNAKHPLVVNGNFKFQVKLIHIILFLR